MISDLILKDTTPDEWAEIRGKLKARISYNLGKSPAPLAPSVGRYEEIERYQEYGFTHIKIKYQR